MMNTIKNHTRVDANLLPYNIIYHTKSHGYYTHYYLYHKITTVAKLFYDRITRVVLNDSNLV